MDITSLNNIISGYWTRGDKEPEFGFDAVKKAIVRVSRPIFIININNRIAVDHHGTIILGGKKHPNFSQHHVLAYAPALLPENLGDPFFKKNYNLKYAYVAGAMANGITSARMVEEAGRAGMIGFFGSAGLEPDDVLKAIIQLKQSLDHLPFGFNLIHTPHNPEYEMRIVQLYIDSGVRLISASAYIDLTYPLVYYRIKGIHQNQHGDIICPNKVIAKVSRVEVAEKFFSPAPEKIISILLEKKLITEQEAQLSTKIPVAESLTAEADSGGHTDNRPAISLLPTMLALRDRIVDKYQYKKPVCVGLAGGISTPLSAAGAFAMGAAYLLTGSVNQSCVEAGTSETVRKMLSEASQADVTMAPAADMFEMGVKVQVLKRGTMFSIRAHKLYKLYNDYDRFENIPENEKTMLEKNFFQRTFDETWQQTKAFFLKHDPKQIEKAEHDPKHKMALVFRSYLGQSSKWAITGDPARKMDYQIWSGPAMGAFNEWVKGSFLEKLENRKTVTVAMNLLFGASVVTRANWLSNQGVVLPEKIKGYYPMELSQIHKHINLK